MNRFACFLPLLATMLTSACAPDDRMPLSECDYGLYWAECGGDGEPMLGCDRGNGDCRWFSGGVTARGYAVADKPVLAGCPEGWPFSDFGPDGALRERVVRHQMALLSAAVITRESAGDLPVTFDLTGGTHRGLARCIGDSCSSSFSASVQRLGRSVVVSNNAGWVMCWELEIVTAPMRSDWVARLYRIDIAYPDGPTALNCTRYSLGREYLGSGVLHLNIDDLSDLDALHGRLEGVARPEEFDNELTFEF